MPANVPKAKKKYRQHPSWVPWAFLAPQLICFICFALIPTVTGLIIPFTKWKVPGTPVWVGLANFREIFVNSDSTYYWQFRWGLESTIKFVLLVLPFRVLVPLILAVLLNTHCRGHKLFQSIYYIPNLFSVSIVMASWNYMFHPSAGLANILLGLGVKSWGSTIPYNWAAMIITTVWWSCGSLMIIFQSALAGVPRELDEAASVDGANFFQRFLHITIPSIKFPLQYTILTSIAGEFNIWAQSDLLNGGGRTIEMVNGVNHKANMMLMQYIIDLGFTGKVTNLGIATSMAMVIGVIVFVVSLIQFRLMRRDQ